MEFPNLGTISPKVGAPGKKAGRRDKMTERTEGGKLLDHTLEMLTETQTQNLSNTLQNHVIKFY